MFKGKIHFTPTPLSREKYELNLATMDKALQKPCMEYKPIFVQSEMEKVKLKNTVLEGAARNAERITREKKCPIFTGKEGIEGLLYVERRFEKAATYIGWTTGIQKYSGFEEVLMDTAEDHWENIVGGIAASDRTNERFKESLKQLYLKYCDDDARGTTFKYLRALKRPVGEDPQTFADRIETLVRYLNKLPGRDRELNEDDVKGIIFDSFPLDWKKAFVRTGKPLHEETLGDILQFLKNEKKFADDDDKKKRKREPDVKRIRGGNQYQPYHKYQRNNNGPRGNNRNNANMCRKHNGQHRWSDCPDNPKNRNNRYGYNNSNRNNNFGRRDNRNGRGGGYNGPTHNNNNSRSNQQYYNQNRNQNNNSQQPNGPNSYYGHMNNQQQPNYYNNGTPPSQVAPNGFGESHHFNMIGNHNGGDQGSAWSTASNNRSWNA